MAAEQNVNVPESSIPFRAETRQLLDILIHSLYTEREVFLRELISNASDALTRLNFEMLTRRDVVDAEAELGIWITTDPEEKTITLRDTGIGMNRDELVENLGTIAHSGARAFLQAAQQSQGPVNDIIGQFGVGFYSAFMVAEWIRVTSRSFLPEHGAMTWFSTGEDTYSLEPADQTGRGTVVTLKLKEDAAEFAQEARLREIIKRHSDFIPYPIYLGEEKQQVNQQTAVWRQQPREVDQEKHHQFYRQFTLDIEPPLTYAHMVVDAPVQLYAMLYVPASPEKTIFTLRKEDGLKLYARKVLIQEYSRDLLPEYFRFVQGVVDSEDLQLNVSRESIQSNRVIAQIKRVITSKVIDTLKKLAADKPEDYAKFWKNFGRFIKEGIATDRDSVDSLSPLLRFHTLNSPAELKSLDDYIQGLKPEQKKIYYLLGDDERSAVHSPHLDVFRHNAVDVLLMTDPLDSFMLMALNRYKDYDLANAAVEKPEMPAEEKSEPENQEAPLAEDDLQALLNRFKFVLGERVEDVRSTDRLIGSPARLVDAEGAMGQEVQRVYRLLRQEFEAPKKVLEINPRHPILKQLSQKPAGQDLDQLVIEQVYENALLIEGLHPDPAGMISRIQDLMKAALK
jgi:molecular chaperone HtpG